MGVPDDFAARLVAVGGIGTTTPPMPTIFCGFAPTTPDQCVQLREHPGFPGERAMGQYRHPVADSSSIQAVVRAATYEAAEELAGKVFNALDGWEGVLNGNTYLWIAARHRPFFLGNDENRRPQFTCNFVALWRP